MHSPPQALNRVGYSGTYAASAPVGTTTILSAAANTTGAVIRSCILSPPTGGYANILINGVGVMTAGPNIPFTYIGIGWVVPAGQAIAIEVIGAVCPAVVSWDVLP